MHVLLETILDLIKMVEEGTKQNIFVHCQHGKNRSPLISIPAIVKLTGDSPVELVEHLRVIRPELLDNPEIEVEEFGDNEEYITAIAAFMQKLFRRNSQKA